MIEAGKYTYGQENIRVKWGQYADVKIGKFCSIAQNVTVYLGGGHRVDRLTTYPFGTIHQNVFNKFDGSGHPQTRGDIVIGNDVWIADNVTIMSGVRIGSGAVIAAGSHVVQNVKPYSVVGGNPAQLYYYRFSQDIIKKLLQLKWWDLDDDTINDISPLLCSGDYEKLFQMFKL